MKLIDFIPRFTTMNVYFDKDDKIIHSSKYEDTEYLELPIEVMEKTQFHEIVKVFKFLRVAVIYGTVFAEEWH